MNEIEALVKLHLDGFVESVTGLAKADFKEYGKEMAEDMARFLYRAHAKGEEDVEKDISHLRAQGKLLLAKHRVHIAQEATKRLIVMLEGLARFGLALLKVNLPNS